MNLKWGSFYKYCNPSNGDILLFNICHLPPLIFLFGTPFSLEENPSDDYCQNAAHVSEKTLLIISKPSFIKASHLVFVLYIGSEHLSS